MAAMRAGSQCSDAARMRCVDRLAVPLGAAHELLGEGADVRLRGSPWLSQKEAMIVSSGSPPASRW